MIPARTPHPHPHLARSTPKQESVCLPAAGAPLGETAPLPACPWRRLPFPSTAAERSAGAGATALPGARVGWGRSVLLLLCHPVSANSVLANMRPHHRCWRSMCSFFGGQQSAKQACTVCVLHNLVRHRIDRRRQRLMFALRLLPRAAQRAIPVEQTVLPPQLTPLTQPAEPQASAARRKARDGWNPPSTANPQSSAGTGDAAPP